MDSLAKLRRGINRISFLLCLAPTALFAEAKYLTAITGSYSLASPAAPANLNTVYSDFSPNYQFTDYGGRFFRLYGQHGFGFSLALVSSLNARALYLAD